MGILQIIPIFDGHQFYLKLTGTAKHTKSYKLSKSHEQPLVQVHQSFKLYFVFGHMGSSLRVNTDYKPIMLFRKIANHFVPLSGGRTTAICAAIVTAFLIIKLMNA